MFGCLGDGDVPVSHQQLVESLVPEEATGEEGARGNSRVERGRPVVLEGGGGEGGRREEGGGGREEGGGGRCTVYMLVQSSMR